MKNDFVVLIFGFFVIIILVALITLVLAFPFMWLWNYAVVAAISVAKPIDYWVAYCLMLFLNIFIASHNSSRKN